MLEIQIKYCTAASGRQTLGESLPAISEPAAASIADHLLLERVFDRFPIDIRHRFAQLKAVMGEAGAGVMPDRPLPGAKPVLVLIDAGAKDRAEPFPERRLFNDLLPLSSRPQ